MTTLKLQYNNFDSGEFTQEQIIDKITLLDCFDQNTLLVETEHSFTINRPYIKFYLKNDKNYLCVAHFAKDAFKVYYCYEDDTKLFEGNFRKETVKDILILFLKNNTNELTNIIPKTRGHKSKLESDFRPGNFLFTFRQKGLFPLIIYFPMSLALLYILLGETNIVIWILFSPFLLLTPFCLRLYLNYLKKSKNVSIEISKGSPMIKIYRGNEVHEFPKTNVKQLIEYTSDIKYKSPFAGYSYSKLILNDNRTFTISFMIIEPYELSRKLSDVLTTKNHKFYPFID